VKEHAADNETDAPVLQVDLIEDEVERDRIRHILLEKYPGARVEIH